jgi:hypothetical protein
MTVLNFIRVQINPVFWIIFFSVLPLLSAFFYFKMCKIQLIQPPHTQNRGFWVSDSPKKTVSLSLGQPSISNASPDRAWRLIYISKQAIQSKQKKQFSNLIKALGKHQHKVQFESITYSDWPLVSPDLNLLDLMPESVRTQLNSSTDLNLAFIQDPENRLILGYPLLMNPQNTNQIYDLQTLRIILHDFQKLLKYNLS